MEPSNGRNSKVFLTMLLISLAAVAIIVATAASRGPQESPGEKGPLVANSNSFDTNINTLFVSYGDTSRDYMAGGSSDRTLEEYYSRRQYAGSPPFIPHPAVEVFGEPVDCLACHALGGWVETLKRFAPVTPHPEMSSCRQCHVPAYTQELFVESNWQTVAPPRLGLAYLPGAPPPIPHRLQMRGNCYACHVGPGAVTPIRTEHPDRGICRQCHMPTEVTGTFERPS